MKANMRYLLTLFLFRANAQTVNEGTCMSHGLSPLTYQECSDKAAQAHPGQAFPIVVSTQYPYGCVMGSRYHNNAEIIFNVNHKNNVNQESSKDCSTHECYCKSPTFSMELGQAQVQITKIESETCFEKSLIPVSQNDCGSVLSKANDNHLVVMYDGSFSGTVGSSGPKGCSLSYDGTLVGNYCADQCQHNSATSIQPLFCQNPTNELSQIQDVQAAVAAIDKYVQDIHDAWSSAQNAKRDVEYLANGWGSNPTVDQAINRHAAAQATAAPAILANTTAHVSPPTEELKIISDHPLIGLDFQNVVNAADNVQSVQDYIIPDIKTFAADSISKVKDAAAALKTARDAAAKLLQFDDYADQVVKTVTAVDQASGLGTIQKKKVFKSVYNDLVC